MSGRIRSAAELNTAKQARADRIVTKSGKSSIPYRVKLNSNACL